MFSDNLSLTSLLSFLVCSKTYLILRDHDIESNPGSNKKSLLSFSCFHWNVNSFLAHNMMEVSSFEV